MALTNPVKAEAALCWGVFTSFAATLLAFGCGNIGNTYVIEIYEAVPTHFRDSFRAQFDILPTWKVARGRGSRKNFAATNSISRRIWILASFYFPCLRAERYPGLVFLLEKHVYLTKLIEKLSRILWSPSAACFSNSSFASFSIAPRSICSLLLSGSSRNVHVIMGEITARYL